MLSARIQGFRCLHDVTVGFDDVTILIGANGAGKSSILRALDWFFSGSTLSPDDLEGCDQSGSVCVTVTFGWLTDQDREALSPYATGETAMFWRSWSLTDGMKLTGRGVAYSPFEAVRALTALRDLTRAYNELRTSDPALGLPPVTSAPAARQAMRDWEEDPAHANLLETATTSATHLFGFVGGPRLAGRFDFVFVAAVMDAQQQTEDARGTLLGRLLERSTADRERIGNRLADVSQRAAGMVAEVFEEEHRHALEVLSAHVTQSLHAYVSGITVSLRMKPVELRLPAVGVATRIEDGDIETDVARQGNGLQRALLLAILQELAAPAVVGGEPTAIFLAIEEPELYQHPTQARHLARVLSALADDPAQMTQVGMATHSPYFIDPDRYESLRRVTRTRHAGSGWGVSEVTAATLTGVARRLRGLIDQDQVPWRTTVTLRRTLSEAVFAQAVVIVEGPSDAGFLAGLGERAGGLDRSGVAVVQVGGKSLIPTVWAILSELGIPTYVVFDGDHGLEERMRVQGKTEDAIRHALGDAKRLNRRILSIGGLEPGDWPTTQAGSHCAVFEFDLETELQDSWPELLDLVRLRASDDCDPRYKSDDA